MNASAWPPSQDIFVLVVEDEPLLLMLACDVVEDAGFKPIRAHNSDEAIEILQQRNDIRIVFTDIDMPGGSMNGLKLVSWVRDRWPPMELIVVSGQVQISESELPARGRFFRKPYRAEAIVETLRAFAA